MGVTGTEDNPVEKMTSAQIYSHSISIILNP